MLQDPEMARRDPEDGRGLFDAQAGNNTQEQGIALEWSQVGEERRQLAVLEVFEDLGGRILMVGQVMRDGMQPCGAGTSSASTALVDQPPMSDREDPTAELIEITLEVREITERPEEHLAREVLGLHRPARRQVAADRAAQRLENAAVGPRGVRLSGPQHGRELDLVETQGRIAHAEWGRHWPAS